MIELYINTRTNTFLVIDKQNYKISSTWSSSINDAFSRLRDFPKDSMDKFLELVAIWECVELLAKDDSLSATKATFYACYPEFVI